MKNLKQYLYIGAMFISLTSLISIIHTSLFINCAYMIIYQAINLILYASVITYREELKFIIPNGMINNEDMIFIYDELDFQK